MHLVRITAPADWKRGAVVLSRRRAGCLLRCVHSRRRRAELNLRRRGGGRNRSAIAALSPRRADCRAWNRGDERLIRTPLVISLGNDWGTTLSQIESLTFFPYDEAASVRAPQTLSRGKNDVDFQ